MIVIKVGGRKGLDYDAICADLAQVYLREHLAVAAPRGERVTSGAPVVVQAYHSEAPVVSVRVRLRKGRRATDPTPPTACNPARARARPLRPPWRPPPSGQKDRLFLFKLERVFLDCTLW